MEKKLYKNVMQFRVDTLGLLTEIADAGLDRRMGVLKIPINIFKDLLADVAQRATEINDPKLNILMLRLALYEVPQNKISEMIEEMEKIIRKNTQQFGTEKNHTDQIIINGELILELKSKQDWVNKVPNKLPKKTTANERYLFVDKNGNVFETGADFSAAEKQNSYPCKVYKLQSVSSVK